MGFKDLSDKLPDRDVLNKVPGFEAITKNAEKKMTDVKEEVTEKVETSAEKVEKKVEELIKH